MKSFYILLMVGLVACGSSELSESSNIKAEAGYAATDSTAPMSAYEEYSEEPAKKNVDASGVAIPDAVTPKLIRTADLRFQVKDINLSGETIEKLAGVYKAYVSNASMNSTNYEANNTLTIRVPNAQFDALLKEISKESIFMERKNVSTQDVTEEFIDITARLKTKKEVEARYIDILRNKAKTVEDVLKAEEQIRIIREEIEAREGRLNYLSNQVSYSTITVQIFEQVEYHESPQELTESFGSKAGSGFGKGWEAIQNVLIGIITIWPILVLVVLVYILIRRRTRKNRKART